MLIEYYKWYSLCKKPIKGIIHGKIQVTNEGDKPFRPVGRKILIKSAFQMLKGVKQNIFKYNLFYTTI